MGTAPTHTWSFRARFRRNAFGWRSSRPAVERVREAVAEIVAVARTDRVLAAEGAILFLEKLSPALEQVDSSSGAIGTAVNRAIDALVEVIALAPADAAQRERWLECLWEAYQADEIPYLETLGDHWGTLCGSKKMASLWADRLLDTCRVAWSPEPSLRGFFKGTVNCLSSLLAAERHEDVLDLLAMAPYDMWHYRKFGVQALAAMGRKAEAIHYAESGRSANDSPVAIARTCEEILLLSGLVEEAYSRYGLTANRAGTYLAWYRAVVKKYPHKGPKQVLADLVEETPGDEGKWFAAAKDAGLLDEAISLASRTPCSPQTLTRAARDFAEKNPAFAIEAGIAALRWIVAGHGYEVTGLDVVNAHAFAMRAATNAGRVVEAERRIRDLVASEAPGASFVARALGARR